jgi:hypothetical protein
MSCTIFAWDFHGPHAEGTARHFLEHLETFCRQLALAGCEAGLESQGPGHHAVWCRTPEPAVAAIPRLRPRRSRPDDRSTSDPADPAT